MLLGSSGGQEVFQLDMWFKRIPKSHRGIPKHCQAFSKYPKVPKVPMTTKFQWQQKFQCMATKVTMATNVPKATKVPMATKVSKCNPRGFGFIYNMGLFLDSFLLGLPNKNYTLWGWG